MKIQNINKALLLGLLSASPVSAAITLTENFDTAAAPASADLVQGFFSSITGWGESATGTTGGFNDFIGTTTSGTTTATFTPFGGTGATPGISTVGYLYRELGTLGGDTSITIGGVNYNRSRAPSTTPTSQFNTLRFELFSLDAASTFTFEESGNDILGIGTSLGSFDVNASTTPGASVSFSQMIDVSAVAADARIFLRISNPGTQNGTQAAFVDNLSIVSIPEPSAALLGGLGMLALLRRRR